MLDLFSTSPRDILFLTRPADTTPEVAAMTFEKFKADLTAAGIAIPVVMLMPGWSVTVGRGVVNLATLASQDQAAE